MNKVILIGRLADRVKLSYYKKSQIPIARFTLAVDKNLSKKERRKRQEEGKAQADFIKIRAVGTRALDLYKYTGKGDKLALRGKIKTSSYKKGKGWVNIFEVLALEVEFLDYQSPEMSHKYMELMIRGGESSLLEDEEDYEEEI